MKKKLRCICLLMVVLFSCKKDIAETHSNSSTDIGIFKGQSSNTSTFEFDEKNQTYRVRATKEEAFRFLWTPLIGDFLLDVKLPAVKKTATYGMMLSMDIAGETPIAFLQISNGTLAFATASQVNMDNALNIKPEYLRLERTGDELAAYYALKGEAFRPLAFQQIDKDTPLYGGLFVRSNVQDLVFSNLRLTYPIEEELFQEEPNRVVSRVEIFDLKTHQRKILLEKNKWIQSPNWHPNGKYLLVNSEGLLYKIPIKNEAEWEAINTDYLTDFNENHGITSDGNNLIVSHNDSLGSRIYQLAWNTENSPKLIVPDAPAFLQDIASDGKEITYLASRERKIFDLYKTRVDTFIESRLTHTIGFDSGGAYASNNKKIYYSSTRSRDMKIWEMSIPQQKKKQLTFDDYQDWFPHPSPDGKHLIFLSHLSNTKNQQYPEMQQIVIRILDLTKANTQPEILFPLFGGNGSINMPSWSPDGSKFAFVSYSFLPDNLVAVDENQGTEL